MSFLDSRQFLPIMIGEGGFYFGKDDLLFLLRNCLPDRTAARSVFLSEEDVYRRTYTYIVMNWSATTFGGVADRGRKHLGKKASGI